jgi:hypothetical protein
MFNLKEVKKAGVAMAVSFRRASWAFIAGGSVFGYESDVSHFVTGIVCFVSTQVLALLLIAAWSTIDDDK